MLLVLFTAAVRILAHSPHQLCGRELNISLVDDAADSNGIVTDEATGNDSKALSCAIEVRDIAPSAQREILLMFFQNRKRSAGGEIEQLIYHDEEHRAVITFTSPEGMVDLVSLLCNAW